MAAQRSWENLPNLVPEIADRLPCPADKHRMSTVCPSWREVMLLPRRARLPWLLLPYRIATQKNDTDRPESVACICCDCIHPVRFPDYARVTRFIGAYEGGWIFIASGHNNGHELINLSTGKQSILLPDKMSLELEAQAMIIRAATLSSPPVQLQRCIAATIVTPPHPRATSAPDHVTFWRMGSRLASCSRKVEDNVEDVIYHRNAFHFLTTQKNLLMCTPEFEEEAPLDQLRVRMEELRFQPVVDEDEECPYFPEFKIVGRYLLECHGDLLMVVRTRPSEPGCREPTSSFRVFRMTKVQTPKVDHAEHSWDELATLDGRMLFVGRGCSRSYEVTDFPGCEEGVYFHDDQFWWSWMVWGYGFGGRKYPCSDNGIWSAPPGNVRRLYLALARSAYSSPVWFLHGDH